MKTVRKVSLLLACAVFFALAACGTESVTATPSPSPPPQSSPVVAPTPSPSPSPTGEPPAQKMNAYLSITYGRDNPNTSTGRETVFYTYDLDTKRLVEQCVVPYAAQYGTGVFSLYDHTLYYSRRTDPEGAHDDRLYAYDPQSGQETLLEEEHWTYNEITLIDRNTLLVQAATYEHTLTPAKFNLTDKTFTYTANVNNEQFDLYSGGPQPFNYNYRYQKLSYIYYNLEEFYLEEHMAPPYIAIDNYIALMPLDLTKNPDNIFSIPLKIGTQIKWSTQISEDTLLVAIKRERLIDDDEPHSGYYLLRFMDGETTFEPVDYPFPKSTGVGQNCFTFDGGSTYYCMGGYYDSEGKDQSGVILYDTSNDKITPILLNDSDTQGHVINFSVVPYDAN